MMDLEATATRALELLAVKGTSAKTLHAYTHTGFGAAVRFFQEKEITCVTPEMLDAFLLEQWKAFEEGGFSEWKWRLIRRGCEVLKYCAEKDSVDLPPLPPWMPALRRPRQSIWKSSPTPEQLADPKNIFTLVWKTNRAMLAHGLSDATVGHYSTEGLAVILNRHYEIGTEQYSEEIVSKVVEEKRHQYEQGLVTRISYQNLRKAAYLVKEMRNTGRITLKKLPDWGQREPIPCFSKLLDEFCRSMEGAAKSTVKAARSAVRRFLFEMEDHGCCSLADFTQAKVNAYVTSFAKHYTGGLRSAIYSVRIFLHFLFEAGHFPVDLGQSLPELTAARKRFHEGFSQDEMNLLLTQPNRSTAVGKRDYALMVLAVQSGLRACDMVRLKLDNIDWRNREIRLIQHKTGQPLSLPLEPESGNAIADYILHGRPKLALTNLFLCHSGTDRPLDARTASGIVSKYMRKAGIPAQRRAFHALRRTFGTGLLQNNVSFELIQQLLGHTDMNSLKPYLTIDEQGLKQCALPLLSYGKDGGGE